MSEGGVMYADIKFKNPKNAEGKVNETASSSNDTTYSEVRIHKTQHDDPSKDPHVTGGDPASQHIVGSTGGSKVRSGAWNPARVALVVLCVLLAAAVIALGLLYKKNMQTEEKLQRMTAMHEAVERNLIDRLSEMKSCRVVQPSCQLPSEVEKRDECFKCEDGWESHGGQCYYFSTKKLSWEDSRKDCRDHKGDLVMIDKQEEQKFLQETVSSKMSTPEDKFWIGLTDSEEESKWLWVDGSPLEISSSFWSADEPDNWNKTNPDGEDCARMGEKGGAEDCKVWFDRSCQHPHKSICEKKAEKRGRLKCV